VGGGLALLLLGLVVVAALEENAGSLTDAEATSSLGDTNRDDQQDQSLVEGTEPSATESLAAEQATGAIGDDPPATQATSNPSFDCARATTRVENMICASDELAALDRKLAASFQRVMAAAGSDGPAVRQDQLVWIQQVNSGCADPQCVAQALRDRTTVLDALMELSEAYGQ
jgi:uncharacterized protein YecT (DUF1311 family)